MSKRDQETAKLIVEIRAIHSKSRYSSGSRKITRALKRTRLINHKRVERICKQEGIRSKLTKKYKATTNSNHTLPVVFGNIKVQQNVTKKCSSMAGKKAIASTL